jgi:hypothetical protein
MTETTNATQTAETAKKPVKRSLQDTRIANNMAEVRTLLTRIQGDAVLQAQLAARGFTQARLTALVGLVGAAQDAFEARQQAIGMQQGAVALTQSAYQETYRLFVELRDSARLAYISDSSAWVAIGAVGRVPTDSDKFQTLVRTALSHAASSPYKEALAAVGFTDAKRATLVAAAQNHEASRVRSDTAKRSALTATETRNTAYSALGTALLPLKRTLKLVEKSG